MSTAESHPPPFNYWRPPPIDKSLPRPAPTQAYSWRETSPNARRLYIQDHKQANQELSRLKPGPLGFDLEWRPTFDRGGAENPVALVQLANDQVILLLQVTSMQEFPSQLKEVLADPEFIKAGVAIQSDALKIAKDHNVSMRNCVDLSLLARTVDNARWQGKYNSPLGLARLVESYEYRILLKGKVTRSNWEARLNEQQQKYASNDAHAGYDLYKRLEAMLPLLDKPAESIWYSFNLISGQFYDSDGENWHPWNPNYDPGPPPPPRLPKEIKASDVTEIESGPSNSAMPDNGDSSRKRRRNNKWNNRNPQDGQGNNTKSRPQSNAGRSGQGPTLNSRGPDKQFRIRGQGNRNPYNNYSSQVPFGATPPPTATYDRFSRPFSEQRGSASAQLQPRSYNPHPTPQGRGIRNIPSSGPSSRPELRSSVSIPQAHEQHTGDTDTQGSREVPETEAPPRSHRSRRQNPGHRD